MDRHAAETMALRHADACDELAANEHELAASARERAGAADDPAAVADLEKLARLHDDAAAFQAGAAAYYRALANRIAIHLVDVGDISGPGSDR